MSEYKVLIIGDEKSGLDLEVRSFDEKPTLKEMQEMVGGYIEFVPIFMGAEMTGVINEEGKLNGFKPNPIATNLYDTFKQSKGIPDDGDWIAGTMFIPINFDID